MFARIHDAVVRAYIAKEEGQTMAEYGLILAAVAVVAVIAFKALGNDIDTLLGNVSSDLTS
jgi:Flp pilus assembly pilin Flp